MKKFLALVALAGLAGGMYAAEADLGVFKAGDRQEP